MSLNRYLFGDFFKLERGEITPEEFTERVNAKLAEDDKRREEHGNTQIHLLQEFFRSTGPARVEPDRPKDGD
jgi:hypothetical protein